MAPHTHIINHPCMTKTSYHNICHTRKTRTLCHNISQNCTRRTSCHNINHTCMTIDTESHYNVARGLSRAIIIYIVTRVPYRASVDCIIARGPFCLGVTYVVTRGVCRARVIDNVGTRYHMCEIIVNDVLLKLRLYLYILMIFWLLFFCYTSCCQSLIYFTSYLTSEYNST